MLPTDAAIASIDAFERRNDKQLNDSHRTQLKKLRESVRAVVHNGRPAIPPIDKNLAAHPLIVRRAKLIETHLARLGAQRDWGRLTPKDLDAIAALGALRAKEAAELLGSHLLAKAPPRPGRDQGPNHAGASPPGTPAAQADALSDYPVALALANIGLPSVSPILQQIILGEDEERTREVAALTLARMMPPLVAAVFVDEAAAKEQTELARQRLVKLKGRISTIKQG